MKKFSVQVSQNGWEYTGYAFIKCNNIEKVAVNKVVADGVEIEFDEEVGVISEIDVGYKCDNIFEAYRVTTAENSALYTPVRAEKGR